MTHRVIITVDDETLTTLKAAAAYVKSTSLNAWIVPTLYAAARAVLRSDDQYGFDANEEVEGLPPADAPAPPGWEEYKALNKKG